MGEGTSITVAGDWSKPATALIEKVSEAVGGIAKPWQIKRVAKAEAEAEKIKAVAKIDISENERRGLERRIREEGKNQENIEAITTGAIPHLKPDAKPEEIEADKVSYIFERARIVSDAEMQSMWSRLLAEEANTKHSFSRTTIDLVSRLEKNDAHLFTKFCTYVWNMHELDAIYPNKIRDDDDVNTKITFSHIMHLESLGLIKYINVGEYIYKWPDKYFVAHYYGRPIIFQFDSDGQNVIKRGNISLTSAGRELAGISGSLPDFEYFEKVLEYWMANTKGAWLSVPIQSKDRWV